MAVQIPPGFAAVTIPLTNPAILRSAAITFGVEIVGEFTPDELAVSVQSEWGTSIGARVDASVAMGPTRVAVGQDGGDPLLGFAAGTIPGGRSLDSIAPVLAMLLQKRTGLGGRRGRGNMYVPWCLGDNTVNEGGIIGASEVSGMQTACNTFIADNAAAQHPVVLLHGTGVSGVPEPTPVVQMEPSQIISHQVRRLPRP